MVQWARSITNAASASAVFIARVALGAGLSADTSFCGGLVLHTECQGYRDPTFDDRVFRYQVARVPEAGMSELSQRRPVESKFFRGR